MYKKDALREYIEKSSLKIVNDDFHIRLSKELSPKYDAGVYNNAINKLKKYIEQIKKLELQYPGNAHPIFYVYLVPDSDFIELLQFPFKTRKSGGRPVNCYDLDGFNWAYGLSQNLCENISDEEPLISRMVNNIHEFAHLVHNQFFDKNCFISEGFAEVLPLYTMDYESKFDEHRDVLKKMKPDQIYSVKELLDMERNNTFYGKNIFRNRSCSFDLSYISSYLFVRACIEAIASKCNNDRVKATQKFLEIIKNSQYSSEWLINDLANILDIPQDELLYQKNWQIKTLENL